MFNFYHINVSAICVAVRPLSMQETRNVVTEKQ